MKKYKYVPNPDIWNNITLKEHQDLVDDLKRFFSLAQNPTTNDEKSLQDNINNDNWDLVFYYWEHNFDTNFACALLAKFLYDCDIDFISKLDDPTKYIFNDELVEVDE